MSHIQRFALTLAISTAGLTAVGCGGGDSPAASNSTSAPAAGATPITIGYSAWPGWFPLKVAEEKGFFNKAGVNVKIRYFTDYTASIDALSAGQIDANTQTLNDTMAGVASGVKLKIVVNTDFSSGNDAVIVDKSITSVKGLKGKKVAAEAGVVDHFLLLQGLKANGLTEKDIDFRGTPTDAAAAAFASGQFDAVAVFAPFTLEALKRPGSKVLFSSKNYPGSIPDHIVFKAETVSSRSADIDKVVSAWYATLDYIKANPVEATAIMAKQAGISPADYGKLNAGTQILDAKSAAAAFVDAAAPTSLPATARIINPFLVESGFTKTAATLDGLFAPEFTATYLTGAGR